jgi:hypothetical protein
VDVDVNQLDAAHHRPAQGDTAETGAGQVDGAQLRAAEVNALKPGVTQISTSEVSHVGTLSPGADNLPAYARVRHYYTPRQ